MMVRMFVRLLCLTAIATLAFGASPVATISSASAFELHGAAVRTEGVPAWPVMAGDQIGTGVSPALIRFRDGSSVTLSQESTARVEMVDNFLVFRLMSGSMRVTPANNSGIKFFNSVDPVTAKPGTAAEVSSKGPGGNRAQAYLVRTPVSPVKISIL